MPQASHHAERRHVDGYIRTGLLEDFIGDLFHSLSGLAEEVVGHIGLSAQFQVDARHRFGLGIIGTKMGYEARQKRMVREIHIIQREGGL